MCYSTSTSIYGILPTENSSVLIKEVTGAKIDFDNLATRLVYHAGSDFVAMTLNGSNELAIKNAPSVLHFALDSEKRDIFYITNLFREVRSVDMVTKAETTIGNSLGSVERVATDSSAK